MGSWDSFLQLLNSHYQNHAYGSGNMDVSTPTGLMGMLQKNYTNGQQMHSNGMQDLQKQYQQMVANGTTGVAAYGQGMSNPMSIADQLQQQLQGIQSQPTPLTSLEQQANATVNSQYDPQINALTRDMADTNKRGKANEHTASSMYNDLAQDIANQLPAVQQQTQADQASTAGRYNDAKTDLQNQYAQQSQNQQGILQQLGIQAAAPDANKQGAADQAYFQNQNDLSKNQALDQVTSQGNADQSYFRSMSDTSKMAGTNASNDIATQLESYMQNAQGQKEDLQGAKSNALTALLQQLETSDAQNQQSQYNTQFDQMMQMNNLQRGLTNDQNSNQMDQLKLALQQQQMQQSQNKSPFAGTSGMTGMSTYLAGKYPDNPGEASQLSSLIASVLSNKDVQNGRRQDGTSSIPVTNEYLIQLLRNQAGQAGVTNPSDINNAIDALLAYKGQLR